MVACSFSDRRRLEAAAAFRTGNAFRPGTRANHQSHLLLYTAFTAYFGLPDFPASIKAVLLFGEFLLRDFKAPKSVTNAFSSIKAFHLDRFCLWGTPPRAQSSFLLRWRGRRWALQLQHPYLVSLELPVVGETASASSRRGQPGDGWQPCCSGWDCRGRGTPSTRCAGELAPLRSRGGQQCPTCSPWAVGGGTQYVFTSLQRRPGSGQPPVSPPPFQLSYQPLGP